MLTSGGVALLMKFLMMMATIQHKSKKGQFCIVMQFMMSWMNRVVKTYELSDTQGVKILSCCTLHPELYANGLEQIGGKLWAFISRNLYCYPEISPSIFGEKRWSFDCIRISS